MSIEKKQLREAFKEVANRNVELLKFFASYKGLNNTSIFNRCENWLQIELLFALSQIVKSESDLSHEVRLEYKKSKAKGSGKSTKGFNTGAIDLVFRPKGGRENLLTAVELKVKLNPTQAIKGGMHDLLKLQAFKTTEWNFRSIYAVCFFASNLKDENKSKYFKFVVKNPDCCELLNFGDDWQIAIIGWESKKIAAAPKERYSEYSRWNKDFVARARDGGLQINKKTEIAVLSHKRATI